MSESWWCGATNTATYEDVNISPVNITYVSVHPVSLVSCEIIKKIPIHHGPTRNRGKGKANRDWEK